MNIQIIIGIGIIVLIGIIIFLILKFTRTRKKNHEKFSISESYMFIGITPGENNLIGVYDPHSKQGYKKIGHPNIALRTMKFNGADRKLYLVGGDGQVYTWENGNDNIVKPLIPPAANNANIFDIAFTPGLAKIYGTAWQAGLAQNPIVLTKDKYGDVWKNQGTYVCCPYKIDFDSNGVLYCLNVSGQLVKWEGGWKDIDLTQGFTNISINRQRNAIFGLKDGFIHRWKPNNGWSKPFSDLPKMAAFCVVSGVGVYDNLSDKQIAIDLIDKYVQQITPDLVGTRLLANIPTPIVNCDGIKTPIVFFIAQEFGKAPPLKITSANSKCTWREQWEDGAQAWDPKCDYKGRTDVCQLKKGDRPNYFLDYNPPYFDNARKLGKKSMETFVCNNPTSGSCGTKRITLTTSRRDMFTISKSRSIDVDGNPSFQLEIYNLKLWGYLHGVVFTQFGTGNIAATISISIDKLSPQSTFTLKSLELNATIKLNKEGISGVTVARPEGDYIYTTGATSVVGRLFKNIPDLLRSKLTDYLEEKLKIDFPKEFKLFPEIRKRLNAPLISSLIPDPYKKVATISEVKTENVSSGGVTVTVDTIAAPNLVAGTNSPQTFIIQAPAGDLQQARNYYVNAIAENTTIAEERRIFSYKYLGTDSGGTNDRAEIVVEPSFGSTFADGDTIVINDVNKISVKIDGNYDITSLLPGNKKILIYWSDLNYILTFGQGKKLLHCTTTFNKFPMTIWGGDGIIYSYDKFIDVLIKEKPNLVQSFKDVFEKSLPTGINKNINGFFFAFLEYWKQG